MKGKFSENTGHILQNSFLVGLLATVCCFLWGSAFPCVKIGYRLFSIAERETGAQILFAGIRFLLAGALTITVSSIMRKRLLKPKKSSWGMVCKLSLAQTIFQYLPFYIGLAYISGVKASIIDASNVFFSILISSLIFHYEKLGKLKILGSVIGFSGVVLINLREGAFDGGISFMGEGFMILSTISYAFSSVLMKKYGQREDPVVLSAYQFATGGAVMVIIGLLMKGELHGFRWQTNLLFLYMALISGVAYTLWGLLLKYNPVGKITVYGFMIPVFGVILSAVLLKEKNQAFTIQGLLSLALVCLGIYIANKDFSKDTKGVQEGRKVAGAK